MPENNDFIEADLRKDPSKDLAKAELYHHHHNDSET
jgi:hypothetical protein